MLPKQAFSMRGLFDGKSGRYAGWQRVLVLGAAVLLIAAIVLAATNEYWRRHRPVYVVNDGGQPIQVMIDRLPPTPVGPLARFELAEGRHYVTLSGAVKDSFDITLETSYFTRWTNNPVWVIGTNGATPLAVTTLHYAVHPRPSEHRLVVAERLFQLPHVDYAFETPPQTLNLDSNSDEKTKTHLDRANLPAVTAFEVLLQQDNAAAWRFAQVRLWQNREDSALLTAYETAAIGAGQMQRARQFLKTGLAERPIAIVWHRTYQDLGRTTQQEAELTAEYDAMLKKEPTSAGLLYLRGRIDNDHAKGQEFFHRACKADATLAWPWMALAYDAASQGDWPQCRALADKAFALKLEYPTLHQIRHEARLATGDAAAVERECRRIVESGPADGDLGPIIELYDALAVQGKTDVNREAMAQWMNRLPKNTNNSEMVVTCRQIVAYVLGDSATLHQAGPQGRALEPAPYFRFQAIVGALNPQEAVEDAELQELLKEPWNALALSISYSLAANRAEAAKWREKACAGLESRDTDSKRAAGLLRGAKPPTQKQLDDVVLSPNLKALFVAALAIRFPEQKATLAPWPAA